MSAGTVILWRHGQTDFNATGRLQGQVDIELNEVGRAQARAAAAALAVLNPAAIMSSDLSRAFVTAQALGDAAGLTVQSDERLRERSFGAWEGLTHPEMEAQWPEAYALWTAGAHPDGIGAQTRREVGERVAAAVADAVLAYDADDVVVIVAHGAAISVGLTALLGLDPEEWRGITGIGNCHWSVLRSNGGAEPRWRLSAHNVGVATADFPQAARIV